MPASQQLPQNPFSIATMKRCMSTKHTSQDNGNGNLTSGSASEGEQRATPRTRKGMSISQLRAHSSSQNRQSYMSRQRLINWQDEFAPSNNRPAREYRRYQTTASSSGYSSAEQHGYTGGDFKRHYNGSSGNTQTLYKQARNNVSEHEIMGVMRKLNLTAEDRGDSI